MFERLLLFKCALIVGSRKGLGTCTCTLGGGFSNNMGCVLAVPRVVSLLPFFWQAKHCVNGAINLIMCIYCIGRFKCRKSACPQRLVLALHLWCSSCKLGGVETFCVPQIEQWHYPVALLSDVKQCLNTRLSCGGWPVLT